jgi:hypothetical protein
MPLQTLPTPGARARMVRKDRSWTVVGLCVGKDHVVFECVDAWYTSSIMGRLFFSASKLPVVKLYVNKNEVSMSHDKRASYIVRYASTLEHVLHTLHMSDELFAALRHELTGEGAESTANVVPTKRSELMPYALSDNTR